MTIEELRQVVELGLESGLKVIKIQDVIVEFGSGRQLNIDTQKNTPSVDLKQMPKDDDMLFWSAGGPLPSELRSTEE